MDLHTAVLKDLMQYLLINPSLTGQEAGEILLNLCHRLERLEAQNTKQDAVIDGTKHSLGQLWHHRNRGKRYALASQAAKMTPTHAAKSF